MTAVKFVLSSAVGHMMLKQTRLQEEDQKRKHLELYGDDWRVTLASAGQDADTFEFYAKPVGIKFKNGSYLEIK
jgi:hypothetical protein